ncbi:hypothetical protein [Paludifilum halophilum]|uniref:Uncharacterized protein n=1 Tax=Paludifilum halophilum TaxID=1642702 RepID=A0A235B2X0_9BACL|nr:hypothetical protein [Paludifilum halophilum]OYD06247.1 hypothetical protein CHM34_17455 [Paludifilum halophilum]
MFIHDTHVQWMEYADTSTSQIFGYLKDAEYFATVQKGIWILQQISGPWGTNHWKALKINPNFTEQVVKKAKRMNRELRELRLVDLQKGG